MSVKWKKTQHPGVRFYEHPTRRHGIGKDRYFAIRYRRPGERHEEGLGWASEKWTAEKAALELASLKKAHKTGEGPSSLAQKREMKKEQEEKERAKREQNEKENITFADFFENTYWPIAKTSKKKTSYDKEWQHFKRWIEPAIGRTPFKEITPSAIERLKKSLLDSGKSPRMIEYVLSTVRHVWNQARRMGFLTEESPTKQVKIPKSDNRRLRFLTHKEADSLLEELKKRDSQTYFMALISLHAGLRASEIFNLAGGDLDIGRGLITVRDAKPGKGRIAFMTQELRDMFLTLDRKAKEDFIFTGPISKKAFTEIPEVFDLAVKELRLNEGITDRRQKIVFHSLRHSYASWLVESGVDLYVVKELLGHTNIQMTQRYAHLAQGTLQNAVKIFENNLTGRQDNAIKAD